MGDYGGKDKWVCPNDRELALRAKLQTGWSVKTGAISTFSRQEQLNDTEQDVIVKVIKRADMLEQLEQQRVGRLVERVENMKRNAMGNGTTQCVLCANEFGLLSGSPLLCNDCRKAVCSKCSVDAFGVQKEQIWLCKICSETREMWKKSGAWFYRGMPNYVAPEKKGEGSCKYGRNRNGAEATPAALAGRGWHTAQNEKESTDSSDDESRCPKVNRRLISRKALYDSGDSDSSASPRASASFPISPEHSSERTRTAPDAELEASGADDDQLLEAECMASVSSLRDQLLSRRGQHSEVAPWRQRHQRHHSADDSDLDTGSSSRISPYLVEDQSVESLGSIGGTGRYVTAHPPRSTRRELRDADVDDPDSRGHSMSMGTLEFSLLLLNSDRALKCVIQKAKDLCGTDYNGFADPFIRLQLLPCTKEGDRKHTKTVHKTVNPEFNESFIFHAGDTPVERSLRLTVLDDYRFGSRPLGETSVPLSLLTPNQTCWLNVALGKCRLDGVTPCTARARVLLSLSYSTKLGQLCAAVLRCVRPGSGATQIPALFVSLSLKPDAGHLRWRTCTKKKMLNPQHNEEFTFQMQASDTLENQFLELSVWDNADEYLGTLELGLHCKAEQLHHWLDCLRFPEQRFERWHPLVPEPLPP